MTATQPEGLNMTLTIEQARHIAAQCWCEPETSGIEMDSRLAEAFARALLSASKPAAIEGWKLVPVEPTQEMIDAWSDSSSGVTDGMSPEDANRAAASGDWSAMLAASPAVPDQSPALIGWWDSSEASGFRWKEGVVRGDFSNGTPIYATAAAPAQSAQPVGKAVPMPGASGFTMAVFEASEIPVGTDLYTSPQPSPTAVVLDERAAFYAWAETKGLNWWSNVFPEQAAELAWQARAAVAPLVEQTRALTVTPAMVKAAMPWLTSLHHMRKTDKESYVEEAIKAAMTAARPATGETE